MYGFYQVLPVTGDISGSLGCRKYLISSLYFGILALAGIIYVVPAMNEHATLAPLP